jgi:cellulose synthase/poly-beta-1,6-N-acetylglucosamine synthase-like glycosyltransferase
LVRTDPSNGVAAEVQGIGLEMMLGFIETLLTTMALLLLLTAAFLALEIAAATFSGAARPDFGNMQDRPEIAVLIPAHNEEHGVGVTVDNVRVQLRNRDRLLVVADNCTDRTAIIAREHGAEAVERVNVRHRGKGYALKFGIDHLAKSPPDIVIVLDADCIIGEGTLDLLAAGASLTGRPVQALYLMKVAPNAPVQQKISAFAFAVKNSVRPSGLMRLGLPCALTGTGMAFPWSIIRDAPLASANIVEDLKLGIDLAIDGHPAVFEPRAKVTSEFPSSEDGRAKQRRRWEHGHLSTMVREGPRLIREAIRQRRPDLAGMALDLLIPPLSLFILVLICTAIVAAALLFWGAGGASLAISAIAVGLVGLSLSIAWIVFARDLLSAKDLIAIPSYVVRKIPMYLRTFYKREDQWIRSSREKEEGDC